MQATIANAGVYTDFSGLAQLRARAAENSPEANREVARQFEALFLQMMLKSMRQAGHVGSSGDSDQTRFYQDMFDKQIALDLSMGQGIGLASLLERQLGGANGTGAERASRPAQVSAATLAAGAEQDWRPADQAEFIRDLWPHARRVSSSLGVPAEVLIAQAALETGWGMNTIRKPDGRSALNLFGIKADNNWEGERVSVNTLEYRDGIARQERADFRSYASLSASLDDYADFLQQNPRYRPALDNAADAGRFLQELQHAGYATDPAYATKIGTIMQREDFRLALAQVR